MTRCSFSAPFFHMFDYPRRSYTTRPLKTNTSQRVTADLLDRCAGWFDGALPPVYREACAEPGRMQ